MIALAADHLWQSTLFALGAGLLTLPLRRNSAGVRYGLWFAASVKFLVPFALLAAAGGALASRLHLTLRPAHEVAAGAPAGHALDWAPEMMAPATTFRALPPALHPSHALAPGFDPVPILLGAWALGLAAILLIWALRWSRIRAAVRGSAPIDLPARIPMLSSPAGLEPGVVGLWRPVLLLPEGIAERLSPAEFDAIVAHELSHVRRRDNLTGAIHMLVQALFWFHPLVWWMGARLIAERERACDEAVVRAGHDRETYARGVIEICRFYLHSPLACVAGASGSILEQRVEEIICRPLSAPLALEAKASIGMAGALALAFPLAAGMLAAPPQPLGALVRAARTIALSASPARPSVSPAVETEPSAEPAKAIVAVKPVVAVLAPPPVIAAPNRPAQVSPRLAELPTLQITPVASAPAEAAATASGNAVAQIATPAEIRRQTYNFAQLFGATSVRLDQLARWAQPVCVTVQGLPGDAAARVIGRIEKMANDLQVGTLQAGCQPNVQVMFTDKPQAVLDRVAAQHERLLGFGHRTNRDKLKIVTHPIQAWYVTATGGEGGNVAGMTFGQGIGALTGPTGRWPHGYQTDDEDNGSWGSTGCGDKSKFTACLTSEFQSVMMVVDTSKMQDVSLGLIADYVTMLAMAQPKSLDGCHSLPSVIELFAKGCPGHAGGDGLTRADAAYLTALYKIDLQSRKTAQQRDIGDRMADILIKTDTRDRLAAGRPAAGTVRR